MNELAKILGRPDILRAVITVVLGASGTYLLLPHRHGRLKPLWAHVAGGVLVALAVLLLATSWAPPGPALTNLFFYAFGIAAVAGGVLMVTTRNPVYSALWFASVVLSTSGLFLLAGAQFLAAGTIIVYAGAIIVTFLFVIMLAQAEGQAPYDRTARAPFRATLSCFLLLWGLLYALATFRTPLVPGASISASPPALRLAPYSSFAAAHNIPAGSKLHAVLDRSARPTARIVQTLPPEGTPPPHVAGLGGTLFADHLITVEVAGVLLFVALVGAAAIATPRPPVRPGARGRDFARPGPLEPETIQA